MDNYQKNTFLEFEGDNWFDRNIDSINSNFDYENDIVYRTLLKHKLNPSSILEIGCSSGHRLNGLKKLYGENNVEYYGIDPSKKAIEYGLSKYNNINFNIGTADKLSSFVTDSMDIVIMGFVFYVIDRILLLKVISEIDRILKNDGILIIVDFFSEIPKKIRYHHINNDNFFTFKQNYYEVFISSKIYFLIDLFSENHKSNQSINQDFNELYTCALLKKNINEGYK
jgi:ubiquinone/menaquinone biosynthesis C-methylase UbiE